MLTEIQSFFRSDPIQKLIVGIGGNDLDRVAVEKHDDSAEREQVVITVVVVLVDG